MSCLPSHFSTTAFAVGIPCTVRPLSNIQRTSISPRRNEQHRKSQALVVMGADVRVIAQRLAAIAAATAAAGLLAWPQPADSSILHLRGRPPTAIGLRMERYLAGCPSSPNCISTMEGVDAMHRGRSWTYNRATTSGSAVNGVSTTNSAKTMQEAVADVTAAIRRMSGASIVAQRETKSAEIGKGFYIHAEFESRVAGYVDDVEFLFMPDGATVEYRSASRLGYYDVGVNRRRMSKLLETLTMQDVRWGISPTVKN